MLGRSVRSATSFPLSLLIAVSACYHAPARSTFTSAALATPSTQASGGEATRKADVSQVALTLSTEKGTSVVDPQNDSATAKAIASLITPRVPELKVERSSTGCFLRLTSVSKLGEYGRLFVIDGVPLSDGFGLSIRTATLERIDVIEDALSTQPYGPRAAHGLVLITTSRAR
jgi:hypothetical protein